MHVDLYLFFFACIKLPYHNNQHVCLIYCIISFQKFVSDDVCSVQLKKNYILLNSLKAHS